MDKKLISLLFTTAMPLKMAQILHASGFSSTTLLFVDGPKFENLQSVCPYNSSQVNTHTHTHTHTQTHTHWRKIITFWFTSIQWPNRPFHSHSHDRNTLNSTILSLVNIIQTHCVLVWYHSFSSWKKSLSSIAWLSSHVNVIKTHDLIWWDIIPCSLQAPCQSQRGNVPDALHTWSRNKLRRHQLPEQGRWTSSSVSWTSYPWLCHGSYSPTCGQSIYPSRRV